MDLAVPQSAAEQLQVGKRELRAEPAHPAHPGASPREGKHTGTSSGINIEPGSDDDGWIVPTPVVLRDGTRLQLYKDGEALQAAYKAIQGAQRRICLEVYIFADDQTGRAFADLLCEKAAQGVKVYVAYDSLGSIRTDRAMFRKMRRAGVRIEEFHPIRPWEGRFSWRPFNRDHRKLLVIDDDVAWLGGLNIGAEYAGSWIIPSSPGSRLDPWRDNAVAFYGPTAQHFLKAFAATWKYVTTGGRIGRAEFIYGIDLRDLERDRVLARPPIVAPRLSKRAPRPAENVPEVGILASVSTTNSPLRPLLHRFVRSAERSVQLTMAYFAPDDDLIDALCDGCRRGVSVQLMLPSRTDVHALITAARSYYEKLLCNGVEVYERLGAVLHAKTMCVDGRVSVVGSTNLDYRSIEFNCELSAIIRNEAFGRQMNTLFANDIGYAQKIKLSEWRKRPWRDRAIQWAVSRARYLL
jgi:cardiolipin synthase